MYGDEPTFRSGLRVLRVKVNDARLSQDPKQIRVTKAAKAAAAARDGDGVVVITHSSIQYNGDRTAFEHLLYFSFNPFDRRIVHLVHRKGMFPGQINQRLLFIRGLWLTILLPCGSPQWSACGFPPPSFSFFSSFPSDDFVRFFIFILGWLHDCFLAWFDMKSGSKVMLHYNPSLHKDKAGSNNNNGGIHLGVHHPLWWKSLARRRIMFLRVRRIGRRWKCWQWQRKWTISGENWWWRWWSGELCLRKHSFQSRTDNWWIWRLY